MSDSTSRKLSINLDKCRLCGTVLLHEGAQLIHFESLPVSGVYLDNSTDTLFSDDPILSLTVTSCPNCSLIQLRQSLNHEFYTQYQFVSSVSTTYENHLTKIADYICADLDPKSHVVEIGANDGTLLSFIADNNILTTGFEPARVPSLQAISKGLTIIQEFFSDVAILEHKIEPADYIVIRHVLEHIDDFGSVFKGIEKLVSPGCRLIIEVPDFFSTAKNEIYSNIYHPHPCYFDLTSMTCLLEKYNWKVAKQGIVDIFGGSLIVEAVRNHDPSDQILFKEMTNISASSIQVSDVSSFFDGWQESISQAREFFRELRRQGMNVAGYGAAERTTSYIGTVGLNRGDISKLYDHNVALQGTCIPGSRIGIENPDRVAVDRPDAIVIFARSYEEEIVSELKNKWGYTGEIISIKGKVPARLSSQDAN